MEGIQAVSYLTSWLEFGRALFLLIHLLGTACFAYIVTRRLVPLVRAERDLRFDRPLARLGKVLKFWFGQWKHPRYRTAGTIHILIFAGFILLAMRAFSVLIVGVSENFVMPGFSGRAGHIYDIITDYAATVVFLCMLVAMIRRLLFKPVRYAVPARYGKAHTADAIFLLALIAVLMLADSFFAAARAAGQAQQGQPVEALAVLSLPWMFQIALASAALPTLGDYAPKTYRLGPERYRVELNGSRIDAHIDRLGKFEYWLTVFGRRFHIVSVAQGIDYSLEVDGVAHKIDRDDGGIVHAPSPAVVVSIAVKPGDAVSVGDRLAVLEAMKMEMQVVAPFSGKVRQVMIIPNVQVDTGAPLLQIDPIAGDNTTTAGELVVLGTSCPPDRRQETIPSNWRQSLNELRQLRLGFDVDPKNSARLLAEWSKNCPANSDEMREAEDEILNIFVDICSLFQREPEVNHRASGEEPSAEAYLFSYLCMLETGGEGLPPAFVTALRRALSHYGVQSLDRSPKLEESLLWIYESHQRMEQQIVPILGLLERRLRRVEVPADASESLRVLLDRMVLMTNGLPPAVTDLAREVRYRYFDQPLFERARKQVYEQLKEHLDYLAANPDAADRHKRVRALVECPQPVVGLFSKRFASATVAMRKLMLEAIIWRYYRIRTLEKVCSFDLDGHCYVSAEYDHEGKRIHVFTTHAEYARLSEVARTLFPMIAEVPPDHGIVIDFYA